MKSLIVIAALITGQIAAADGFKCITESGLKIQAYNHTNPNAGTRSAAVLVVSDANVGYGNKTIASFNAEKGVLASQDLTYTAKVDLRMVESNRRGENIGGTKLGYLAAIKLDVDFTYSRPVPEGTRVQGLLTLIKRDGTRLYQNATCTRYLKN